MMADTAPTWMDDVQPLFAQPYWVDPARREQVAQGWQGCMSGYGLRLDQYDSVRALSVQIYQFLHTREMPLTSDVSQQWPDAALELFRLWVNQGWRKVASDPPDPATRIPEPSVRPLPVRVRRDVLSLTPAELDDYRARVDDAFRVADPSPEAPGQRFFAVHGDWCLHYQEAFLLWHRAYLMAFEQRVGAAVPYWNWYAQDAAVDGAPPAGLPQAFRDETYVHPGTGEVRPNPLRYAAAKGGASKACAAKTPWPPWAPPPDCRFVQRDPLLYTTGDDQRDARAQKLGLARLFQGQVQRALGFDQFSWPQGAGYPWANITSFDPPPPDSDYVYRDVNFDGAYEQPHDNFHGWVGPDMADNAYTAFDPVFWSYHANIDRVFEIWLRGHADTAMFTGNTPLRPFTGARAEGLDFTDPRRFAYTAIGDLAKDSRALGYDFAPPAYPDFVGVSQASAAPGAAVAGARRALPVAGGGAAGGRAGRPLSATGLRPLVAAPRPREELLVVFDGVRCTFESYAIDVFLDQPGATAADARTDNPHYVGRMTRLGMGQEDDKGRCIAVGVRRVLDATAVARALGLAWGDPATLSFAVTELATGRTVAPEVVAGLPGFAGTLRWARAGWAPRGSASAEARASPAR